MVWYPFSTFRLGIGRVACAASELNTGIIRLGLFMCEICALFLFVSFLPFAKYEIPTLGTREIRVFFKVLKKISFCGSFLD